MSAKDDMLNVATALAEQNPWDLPLVYTGIERAEDRDSYVIHFSLRCHRLLHGKMARLAAKNGAKQVFENWWREADKQARPPPEEEK